MKNMIVWEDNFIGHRVYSATAGSNVGHNWLIVDTSSSGTPTYAPVVARRGVTLTLEATEEVQNVCMAHGNKLGFDIDDLVEVEWQVKMGQALLDSATSLAFGMTGDRHDAIDSIAYAALFRLIGASAAVLVETDDGVRDNDDVATGKTLATTMKRFVISFATGKSDVRFFVDGQPVATSTTFDMSAYTGAMQPLLQIQKSSDTAADAVTVEKVKITCREP